MVIKFSKIRLLSLKAKVFLPLVIIQPRSRQVSSTDAGKRYCRDSSIPMYILTWKDLGML